MAGIGREQDVLAVQALEGEGIGGDAAHGGGLREARGEGGQRADPQEQMTAVDHAAQYSRRAGLRVRKTT